MGTLYRKNNRYYKKTDGKVLVPILVAILIVVGIAFSPEEIENDNNVVIKKDDVVIENNIQSENEKKEIVDLSKIPPYSTSPYVVINNNVPFFNDSDLVTSSYETYGNLDDLRQMHCNYCVRWKRYNANRRERQHW